MKKGKNLLESIPVKYDPVPLSEPVISEESDQIFYRNLSLTFRRREYILSKPVISTRAQELFKKARIKLRGILVWKKVLDDIHEYGLNSRNLNSLVNFHNSTMISHIPHQGDRFLFYPDTPFKKYWNFLVFLMIFYVLIGMPWVTAFENEQPWTRIFIFEATMDFLFFLDILITFNSAFVNDEKKVVVDRWVIARSYVKGMFILDFFSIMPFYLLDHSNSGGTRSNAFLRMIRITKVIRIFRASKILKIIEHFSDTDTIEYWQDLIMNYQGTSRLIATVFVILIMGHISACMWYFFAKLDDFGPDTWVSRYGWLDESAGMLYLRGLYFTFTVITTVGFGDIYAYTITEMVICVILMLFGISFYSFLVGTLSSLISSIDAKAIRISAKLDFLEKFCKENFIPEAVFRAMKKFTKSNGEYEIMEEKKRLDIISQMPKDKRYEIVMSMFNELPKKVFFFQEQSVSLIIDIVPRLNLKVTNTNEFVYKKGEHPTGIYFIAKGRVSFLYNNDMISFKTMIQGSYFGEIEVIEKCLVKFSACSDTECSLLVMSEELWNYLLMKFPDTGAEMKKIAKIKNLRNSENLQEIIDVIELTDIRKELDLSQLCGKKRIKNKGSLKSKQQRLKNLIVNRIELSKPTFMQEANKKMLELLSSAKTLSKSLSKLTSSEYTIF
jgi:CRP-like cAMP-binding protein